jgi:peptidoglycan/LPS O-acetylase OafA/YrhL
MFFAISGFLIAQSLQRRALPAFALARGLRIFPGLAVCAFVTALALAPLSSLPLTQYLENPQTLKFALGNATLLSTEYSLPGVFFDHRSTQANGSLWTLRYELACYFLMAALFVATIARPALRKAGIILALIAGFVVPLLPALTHHPVPVQVQNMAGLFMPFIVGSWVFWSRMRLTLVHVFAGLFASVALSHTPFYEPATTLTVAIFTLWIALTPFRALALARNMPDYSYGIYIYAYPIQQVVWQVVPGFPPLAKALMAFLVVLIPASLSWHSVERPCLALKKMWRPDAVPIPATPLSGGEPQPSRIGTIS